MDNIATACRALAGGGIVAVYDGDEREGEADLVFHPSHATPDKIMRLRKDAGGLICFAIGGAEARKLGLGMMTDLLEKGGYGWIASRKTAYGDEPAFSITVNHRKVFTGITDNDRALTCRELAKLVSGGKGKAELAKNFVSPGHMHLLISRGIETRRGHTELTIELAERAKLPRAMVLCEMLGDDGKALPRGGAAKYAKKNGIPFIEGWELWRK
jgi:3,4-dihydroxy 2-butanone 4-phosphate synthase